IGVYALAGLIMTGMVAYALADIFAGLGHGGRDAGPVFEHRSAYYLRIHGEYERVSESHFRFANTIGNVLWTLGVFWGLLLAFNWSYFGYIPWGSSQGRERQRT